ncbi:amidohydrolase family protein [Mariniflexile sp.]|uniref:amidohydrolase family protein n=1 Tax=Mariniflexile sp. TaxID=1979402 RepID=UPI0040478DAA
MHILKKIKFIFSCCVLINLSLSYGQETFPKNDISDQRTQAMALTHATIVVNPKTILVDATLIVRDGIIESVVPQTQVPKGYREIDLQGNYIYPSFIDMFSHYGQPKVVIPPRGSPYVKREQVQSDTKGAYNANEAIKSDYQSAEHFQVDKKAAEKLRAQGFGTVATIRPDGIARGTASLVVLGDGNENNMVIKPKAAAHYSFDKGSSSQDYPVSPMGAIALLRQTFYDAQWYAAQQQKPFTDLTLESLAKNKGLPQIMEADGWLTTLRANKISEEFQLNFIIKGGGDEYQRIEEIKQMNASLIIPLNFPSAFDVSDPYLTPKISLTDLKHWELAPSNPARLEEKGITFALTSYPMDSSIKSNFLENLRKSVSYGLSKEKALSALTTVPASLLDMNESLGTLEKGKLANFIIADGELFDKNTVLLENYIKGERFIINASPDSKMTGEYSLTAGNLTAVFKLETKNSKYAAQLALPDGTESKATFIMDGDLPLLEFEVDNKKYNLVGWADTKGEHMVLKGDGTVNFEEKITWKATKNTAEKDIEIDKKDSAELKAEGAVIFPFMAFGTSEKIEPETILITNATVWTNEKEGILENTDVLLSDGKIAEIGKTLTSKATRTIDGTGKHLTPGIIDEHSHIAISAVNEIAANSGMVRMQDVLDSEDAGIYRALAGGVVAAHILHGSSDPIGGQSALIKFKWGENPEGLKIKNAAPFIKFALGENPKRSKSDPSIRFPRSLMGLEQFYSNAFTEALDYRKEWNRYDQLDKKQKSNVTKPRKDLLKEAMLEVVEGKRFISAHSYQQKEMLMLMDVADRYGFTINTFTHVLEGYRIADKMREHGVGGSTFSDKWNFKWETRNAIPYNATIMNNAGVLTAINSDSQETIRHLNHEAAKSVKYGNTSTEDALKMITLNPAKLLHLDDTMGSIKKGKSADVVLWSGPPLSVYSKPEKTIIEGAIYFDMEQDKMLREKNEQERSRIIQLMSTKEAKAKATSKVSNVKPEFDCEYLEMGN